MLLLSQFDTDRVINWLKIKKVLNVDKIKLYIFKAQELVHNYILTYVLPVMFLL